MPASPPPSPRLRYRRLGLADAPFVLALLTSPGWLANIGDRGVHDLASAEDYLRRRVLPTYAAPARGPYALVDKGSGALIGTVGIYERPGLDVPDLGFALLPAHQGRGLATEAAGSLLRFAGDAGLTQLSAISLPQNGPSRRLLAGLGFRESGLVTLPGSDTEWVYQVWGGTPEVHQE